MRRFRWAVAVSAVAAGSAGAGEPVPEVVYPAAAGNPPRVVVWPPDCPPPPRPSSPWPPVVPPVNPDRPPGKGPDTPPPDPTQQPGEAARAPEAGTQPAGSLNPNMFGDFFGGAGSTRLLIAPRAAAFTGTGDLFFTPTTLVRGGGGGSLPPTFTAVFSRGAPGAVANVSLDGSGSKTFGAADFSVLRGDIVQRLRTAGFQPPAPGSVFDVNRNTTNIFSVLVDPLTRTAAGRAAGAAVLNAVKGPGSPFLTSLDSLTLDPTGTYSSLRYGFTVTASGLAAVPFDQGIPLTNPAGGGVVGRTKISEDNSPFPRDRAFFNYDYYAAAQLTAAGFNVHRMSAGFETTFSGGRGSVEVRVPFASTLDSTFTLGGLSNRNTELGNVAVALKWLWNPGAEVQVASGLSAALPTGSDSVVNLADGTELARIRNETVLLTAYTAGLWTPTDRAFAQAWASIGGDLFGNRLSVLGQEARIYDLPLVSADFQVGYWVIKDTGPGAAVRGIAPFIELHWNTALDVGRASASVNGTPVVESRGGFDDVNVTVGASVLLRNNLSVSQGLVIPVRDRPDRFFDWQYGLRVNWLFGAQPAGPDRFAPGTAAAPPAAPGAAPEGGPPEPEPGAMARAPEAGTQPAGTLNPGLFGDLIGVNARTPPPVVRTARPGFAQIPVLPRYAGLKVSDNDSPRPADRFFFSLNHYSDVNQGLNPAGSPALELDRQIVGFESTIGEDASVAVRLPFIQLSGSPAVEARTVGDLTVSGKYALVNDLFTGNVFTLGLNVTLPTGGRGDGIGRLGDGSVAPRAVFVQPWVGAAWNSGDVFYQGVSSLLLPTDPVYPAVLFNSVGAGYWLYRNPTDSLLRGIAPVAELHVNTPLTNRGDDARVLLKDQVNLTTGVYLQFPRLTVGGSVCVPLAGPLPYDLEAMLSVNYQF